MTVIGLLLSLLLLFLPTANAEEPLRDALGRQLLLKSPPQRIVSLSPGITEMLFALGLGKRVVGVTRYCDYPPEAKQRVQVGGYYDPSLEKIVALAPDLVVISADGYNQVFSKQLDQVKITYFVVKPRTVSAILETMHALARLTHFTEQAEPVLTALTQRVEAVDKVVGMIPPDQRRRVFYALGPRELWTTGGETFVHDLIVRAGGINVALKKGKPWYQYSPENLVLADPDFILTGQSSKQSREDVLVEWKLREEVAAVAAGRFCLADTDSLSRPGPRAIGVLEQLVATFYGVRADSTAESSRQGGDQ